MTNVVSVTAVLLAPALAQVISLSTSACHSRQLGEHADAGKGPQWLHGVHRTAAEAVQMAAAAACRLTSLQA